MRFLEDVVARPVELSGESGEHYPEGAFDFHDEVNLEAAVAIAFGEVPAVELRSEFVEFHL